ncbi:MAG: EF-hand domain-containing protein [archaeon]|nr:EF-hand domain-containing protein [archaeon]
MVDKMFDDADLNKNGKIEMGELTVLLKGIHEAMGLPQPTQDDIQKELNRLDINKDQLIDKEEFKVFCKEIALFSIDQM